MTWIKIQWVVSSSTLFFSYSQNGANWSQWATRTGMSQPTVMGICLYSNSGTIYGDAQIMADWFRVTTP